MAVISSYATRTLAKVAGVDSGGNAGLSDTLTLAGGTVTASTPILNLPQTWNNAAVNFTGAQLSITRTAANLANSYDFRIVDTGPVTNEIRYVSVIDVRTSGTAAQGLGGAQRWLLQNASGTPTFACDINVLWNDATTGAEYSQVNFDIMSNGSPITGWALDYSGALHWRPFYVATTSRSPSIDEMSSVYVNNAAASTINLQTPVSSDGQNYAGKTVTGLVTDAGGMTINAVPGQKIYIGDSSSSASGSAHCATVGASIVLMVLRNGDYYSIGHEGTWTLA